MVRVLKKNVTAATQLLDTQEPTFSLMELGDLLNQIEEISPYPIVTGVTDDGFPFFCVGDSQYIVSS